MLLVGTGRGEGIPRGRANGYYIHDVDPNTAAGLAGNSITINNHMSRAQVGMVFDARPIVDSGHFQPLPR